MKVKKIFNPIVEDIYIRRREKKKKVYVAEQSYGNTVLFDAFRGSYEDDKVEGYFNHSNWLKKVGKIFRPRWDIYQKKYVLIEKQARER